MNDFFRQEIPFILETKRMFASGTPFWSWNTFFGDNFIASYSFYTLTSPFVWINCLFPTEWMVHSLFLTLILKYICTFLSANFYLRKMNVSKEYANIGGLMYAFSSYAISNSFYYHFFEPMIMFPILLIAIERFLCREKYSKTTLILAAFFTSFINYYFAICSFFAAAMYVFCRILFSVEIKKHLKRIPLGVCLILLGIMMDSFLLIPTAIHLSGGERASQGILTGLDFTALPFFIERLRTLFMLQPIEETTTLFQGTGFNSCSVTLPVVGVFVAFLYCLRDKKSWITFLVLIGLISFLTPLNSIFSLFTNPNYTRWAYALTLFLILATVKWMENFKEKVYHIRIYLLLYILVAVSVYSFALWRGNGISNSLNYLQFIAYTCLLIVSMICLTIYILSSMSNRILFYGIIFCAVIQMISFNILRSDIGLAYDKDVKKKDMIKTYLYENTLPRKSNNSEMHYRTAFEGRYANLGLLKNRPSVSSFHSVLNTKLYDFVTIADTSHVSFWNTFVPNYYRRSFYALMSVKETIDYTDPYKNSVDEKMNYSNLDSTKNYVIYQNNDYIPLGFCYDSYIQESQIDSLLKLSPKPDIPLIMLSNIVIPKQQEKLFSSYLNKGTIDFTVNIDSVIHKRKENASIVFYGSTKGFVSKVNLSRKNFVFYSVPADEGFKAYVDGQETKIYKVNLGLAAILVPQGIHEIKFNYYPKGFTEGLFISLIMLMLSGFISWREFRTTHP